MRGWRWVLVAACALAYANGLRGDFTYDDKLIVRDDPRIQSWSRLPEIFTTQYFGGAGRAGTAYRPADLLSFAADYAVFGARPAGYHATNVALHLAVTLLLFELFARRFGAGLAGPAALLFAVMPVHVEAVTSIVGRAELLAAALVLLALLLAQRARGARGARRKAWWILSAGLYFAAMLSKESAVVMPGLLLLDDLLDEPGGLLERLSRRLARSWRDYAVYVAPLAAMFALRRLVLHGFLMSSAAAVSELENPLAALSPLSRAGNACGILLRGLGRTVWPGYLSADESAWQLRPWSAGRPVFWLAVLLAAGLAAAGLAGMRRRPAVALGILFFCLAALPTANVLFPIGTIMAERLMYLPSAGIALALAAVVEAGRGGRARRFALALACLALLARTWRRNEAWRNDATLFADMLATAPGSAKAQYNFAYDASRRGDDRAAYLHYRRASEIFPRYYDAWAARGRVAGDLGDLSEAVADARRSVAISPAYENGWFTAGLASEERGDFALAERLYREGLSRCPSSYPLAYRLAALLARRGRAAQALPAFRRALALSPGSAIGGEGLGSALEALGRLGDAEDAYADALDADGSDRAALSGEARLASARGHFRRAADARLTLARVTGERAELLAALAEASRSAAGRALLERRRTELASAARRWRKDPAVAAALKAAGLQ